MKQVLDKNLFKRLLTIKPFYFLLYTALLVFSFVYYDTEYDFSHYSNYFIVIWALIIFLYIYLQQDNLIKRDIKREDQLIITEKKINSTESDNISESGTRVESDNILDSGTEEVFEPDQVKFPGRYTVYNTFGIVLYLKVLGPLFISLLVAAGINAFKETTPYFNAIVGLCPQLMEIVKTIIILTALALFLYVNFKTPGRIIIFTGLFYVSAFIILMNLIMLKKYLPGFYTSYTSVYSLLDNIIYTKGDKFDESLLFITVITVILFLWGQRIYIKNISKYPNSVVDYYMLAIFYSYICIYNFSPNVCEKLYIAVIAAFILSFILGLLIHLALYCKRFNFIVFLKRSLIVFAILSLITTGLRFDVFGFTNRIPDTKDIEYTELRFFDTSEFFLFQTANYQFKSIESINAIKFIHKNIIEMQKEFPIKYKDDDSNLTTINIKYKLKNGGSIQREYTVVNEYKESPNVILPLFKTEEFKDQYFKFIYTKEEITLIFIEDLVGENDYLHIVQNKLKNKNLATDLIKTVKSDIEKYDLNYMTDQNTKYRYTLQVIFNIQDEPQSYMYYIPDLYKDTISYIEEHAEEIKKEEINYKIG